MATGGYKLVQFSWGGGRSDSKTDRVKFILNGITQAVVDANLGWGFDTLTPTSSDFLTMPSNDASNYPDFVKVLSYTSGLDTYKLCFGYLCSSYNAGFWFKPSDCNSTNTQYSSYGEMSQNGKIGGGLYVSMIKNGTLVSDSTYGYVWDGNGVFLRWCPFALNISSVYNAVDTFAYRNESGVTYTIYALIKGQQVGIFERSSAWNTGARLKGLLLGEIFNITGHNDDSYTMGSLGLSDNYKDENGDPNSGYINASYGATSFGSYGSSQILTKTGVCIPSATGDACTCVTAFDTTLVDSNISPTISSSGGRWTPVYMYANSADHDTYGVVAGDGFKGYVDTNLIIGVSPNYSYGQVLGTNGEYVYLGGGFAVGWDSTNTNSFF